MEYKGKLQRWNDEKGFGFIAPENAGQREVFLHISALTNTSRRPVIGDIIFYQLYTDSAGKVKAVNARIDGVSFVKPKLNKKYTPKQSTLQNKKSFSAIKAFFLLAVLGSAVYGKFNSDYSTAASQQNFSLNPNASNTDNLNSAESDMSDENSYVPTALNTTSNENTLSHQEVKTLEVAPESIETTPISSDAALPKSEPYVESSYHCDGRQHCSQMTSCEEAEFFIKNCPDTKMDGDNDGIPCESQWCSN